MNYSTQVLRKCFEKAIEDKQAFLACKHPKSRTVHLYQSNLAQDGKSKIRLQTFDTEKPFVEFGISNHIILAAEQFTTRTNFKSSNRFEDDFPQYRELFDKAQKFLNEGNSKVVISRKIDKQIAVDVVEVFKRLISTFDNAFVYVLYHPLFELWIGATPESLAEVQGSKLKTTALAGTTKAIESEAPKWRAKELLEQEIVQTELIERFKENEIYYQKKQTTNFKYGHLYHLKTDFTAFFDSHQKAVEAVSILHPTSAVCGFPREEAKAFILEHEKHARELYTGYIGIVHEESAFFYVNLRCMKISEAQLSLYVGGGLNKSSSLEEEFEETNQKAKALLDILNGG